MNQHNNANSADGRNLFVTAFAGLLFGVGLSLSEMVVPQRVLGFLDVLGSWDPTLAFVMGGALLITVPAFQYGKRKMQQPVCAVKFQLPTRSDIDAPLLGGAAIFGVGWGLAGLCPGPALVALGTLDPMAFLFVGAMVAGSLSQKALMP